MKHGFCGPGRNPGNKAQRRSTNMVFNTGMSKDRTSHYKNTLPKGDGKQLVVPNHTREGSRIRQFQAYVYMDKNRTKSEYNHLKVKDISNLSA